MSNEMVVYENGAITVAQEICKRIAEFERKALEIDMAKKEIKEQLKKSDGRTRNINF